jgi:hypothetical protein
MAERYLLLCEKHRLLVTGGSDCHGYSKGKPVFGGVRLPMTHVRELKARLAARGRETGPDRPAASLTNC